MQKPVIAVDIDDVIFPFVVEIASHYNALKGAKLTKDDFFSYHFRDVWGGTEEEGNEVVATFLEKDVVHVLPLEGAKEAFEQLKKDFTIMLVTARNGIFEKRTRQWLEAHFGGLFHDVIFAGNPHDTVDYRKKGEICRELKAVCLIDDSPSNLVSAIECGIQPILFGAHPWNMHHELPAGVPRCSSWEEVTQYIYSNVLGEKAK